MLVVEGVLTGEAEAVESATALITALVRQSRSEPGCVDFVFSEEIGSPGTIRIFQRWKDRSSFENHFTTEHYKHWRSEADKLNIIRRSLFVYEDVAQPVPR